MSKTKKESAEAFLAELMAMDEPEIQKLLDAETDAELIQFLGEHSSDVMSVNLHQPLKAAFILILAGYLMRAREDNSTIWLSPKGDA